MESVSDETEGGAERGGQAWRSGSQSLQIFLDRILHACMTRVYVCTVSHFASLRYSIIIYIIVVLWYRYGTVVRYLPVHLY